MDVTDEMIDQFSVADSPQKCDNCSSSFRNDRDYQTITKLDIGSAEIQIWNALHFIYGISWTSFQNYNSEKRNLQLKSQDDLTFCSNCASLLNENYKSHINFEHSIESSSFVGLLKEFRDHQNSSTEQHVELLPQEEVETVERDIKVDPFDSFVFDTADEDPIESEVLEETKYEPSLVFSESISITSCEEVQSSRRTSFRSKRKLIIKAEKLTQEEILQFTGGNSAKKKRATPRNISSVNIKNTGNYRRTENEYEVKTELSPEERKLKGAKKFQKRRNFKAATRKKPGNPNQLSFQEKVKLVLEKHKGISKCVKIPLHGNFICNICGKGFKDYSYLRFKHYPIHQQTERTVIVCEICGKSFKSRKYVKYHIIKAHGSEEEQNKWKRKCEMCDEMIFSFYMTNHLNTTHNRLPPVKCDQCDKVCPNKESLKSHYVVHNRTSEKCDLCDKVFSAVKYLLNHKSKVHGNRERKFSCDQCPMKFRSQRESKNHMTLTHSDLRKYVCEECGKTFKYLAHFRAHLKCHKEIAEKGGYAFKCDKCEGKTFKHSLSLRKHNDRMHPKTKGAIKIHECSMCGKRLSSATILKTHENMHKQNADFKPRVRNKLPDYIKAHISCDNKLSATSLLPPPPTSDETNIVHIAQS